MGKNNRLQRYLTAIRMQYKLMILPSILPALCFAIVSPLFFSIRNLNGQNAAIILERFFALTGVLILTPLPLPEQEKAVQEVVESRYTSQTGILALRLLVIVPMIPILMALLCSAMVSSGSIFPFGRFIFGGSVTALALGTLGFSSFLFSGNWIVGYLVPTCYFVLNMVGETKLGQFYLFSLGTGSMLEKYWLLGTSILLLFFGFLWKQMTHRL